MSESPQIPEVLKEKLPMLLNQSFPQLTISPKTLVTIPKRIVHEGYMHRQYRDAVVGRDSRFVCREFDEILASDIDCEIRLRFRRVLLKTLEVDDEPLTMQDARLAKKIESVSFELFQDYGIRYQRHMRKRMYFLKSKTNLQRKIELKSGKISATEFGLDYIDQLAKNVKERERRLWVRDIVYEHSVGALNAGTRTSDLRCGKCKARDASYNQVQTRSADEPMTVFVLCNQCGNRWRM